MLNFRALSVCVFLTCFGGIIASPSHADEVHSKYGGFTQQQWAIARHTVFANFVGAGGEHTNYIKFGDRNCSLSSRGITRCQFCSVQIDVADGEMIIGDAKIFAISYDGNTDDEIEFDGSHTERIIFLITNDHYCNRTNDELTAWCDRKGAFTYQDIIKDGVIQKAGSELL